VIEVIAQPIAGIRYGDQTTLRYNPEAIAIGLASLPSDNAGKLPG
jgi:hypothetical protein